MNAVISGFCSIVVRASQREKGKKKRLIDPAGIERKMGSDLKSPQLDQRQSHLAYMECLRGTYHGESLKDE